MARFNDPDFAGVFRDEEGKMVVEVLNQFGANGALEHMNRGGIGGRGHKAMATAMSTRAMRRKAERELAKQAKKRAKG